LIPAILLVIGVAVFPRINTLNAAKTRQNRERLKEFGL